MADSTSARSAFWLTEKLGRTSHPIRSFLRGEKETVKQPSPSTYPDIYEEMSISPAGVLAASTRLMSYINVFSMATLGIKPQSIRGQFLSEKRLPSVPPSRDRTSPFGLHRYKPVRARISLARQGISLP